MRFVVWPLVGSLERQERMGKADRRQSGPLYCRPMPAPRRFPPPWSVEETDACFIIRDSNRQAVAHVYCEEEPGRRSTANPLTRDEARRIAANIAKLPMVPSHIMKEIHRQRLSPRRKD